MLTCAPSPPVARRRTARTVDGHHCRPPCAVGTLSAVSSRAISPKLLPAARSARIRSTIFGATAARRPGRARGVTCRRAPLRCSASRRSSSSAGINCEPHGISIASTNGRTRRSKVDRLTPSAAAACARVYANRSTRVASRTGMGGVDARSAARCRCAFSLRRLRRRCGIHTTYTNVDAYLHRDASASRWLPTFAGHGRSP